MKLSARKQLREKDFKLQSNISIQTMPDIRKFPKNSKLHNPKHINSKDESEKIK